jgi:hypothetical protein
MARKNTPPAPAPAPIENNQDEAAQTDIIDDGGMEPIADIATDTQLVEQAGAALDQALSSADVDAIAAAHARPAPLLDLSGNVCLAVELAVNTLEETIGGECTIAIVQPMSVHQARAGIDDLTVGQIQQELADLGDPRQSLTEAVELLNQIKAAEKVMADVIKKLVGEADHRVRRLSEHVNVGLLERQRLLNVRLEKLLAQQETAG